MVLMHASTSRSAPQIPLALKTRLQFTTTCEISKEEAAYFTICINALWATLQEEKQPITETIVNCCIVDSDSIGFSFSGDDAIGMYFPLIIYPIHRWRNQHFTEIQWIACILEELCHHFYATFDEDIVKDHVEKVALKIHPGLTFDVLYPGCCVG